MLEMDKTKSNVRTCKEMLLEFKNLKNRDISSKLLFDGIENEDVYNITAPFLFEGKRYLAGRVEKRTEEWSRVVFFMEENEKWIADNSIPSLPLQDPFVTQVNGEFIVGGVEVFDDVENPGMLNYRTNFYRGNSLRSLTLFAKGPDRMKDIRLLQLEKNQILVMTRPQGSIFANGKCYEAGRGKIGYMIIHSLDELTPEAILDATIFDDQFISEEWGGCNQLFMLGDGNVGILSHIARFDEAGNRHYYSSAFCMNPQTGEHTPMKLIAVRDNFALGDAKRPDLTDVIFSGGLERNNNKKAMLYCGVSDAQGHRIEIDDPFE